MHTSFGTPYISAASEIDRFVSWNSDKSESGIKSSTANVFASRSNLLV